MFFCEPTTSKELNCFSMDILRSVVVVLRRRESVFAAGLYFSCRWVGLGVYPGFNIVSISIPEGPFCLGRASCFPFRLAAAKRLGLPARPPAGIPSGFRSCIGWGRDVDGRSNRCLRMNDFERSSGDWVTSALKSDQHVAMACPIFPQVLNFVPQ